MVDLGKQDFGFVASRDQIRSSAPDALFKRSVQYLDFIAGLGDLACIAEDGDSDAADDGDDDQSADLLATASVAIDGSKFKAVNNRDKNFTRAKVERRRAQLEESVARYLSQLDTADRQEPTEALAAKVTRLHEKLTKLKEQMGKLAVYEKQMLASPDQQISLTDPDSRSMATSGRGSGIVGYNVQVAVDTEHHLIIAHEVTNSGSDRAQLARMAKQTKATLEATNLDVIADRGYFSGEEILECDKDGITV